MLYKLCGSFSRERFPRETAAKVRKKGKRKNVLPYDKALPHRDEAGLETVLFRLSSISNVLAG